MERYDVKILLMLLKAIQGYKDYFEWLLKNGYPELAAFSGAIRGDRDALRWLFDNKCEWLGIIVNAIDGKEEARQWLAKGMHPVNLMFAMACIHEETAIRWLRERDLQVFLLLADEVYVVSDLLDAEAAFPYVYHSKN